MTSTMPGEGTLTWCGACESAPLHDEDVCPRCGAGLRGEAADRLRLVATERRQLRSYVAESTARLGALESEAAHLTALLRLPLPAVPAPQVAAFGASAPVVAAAPSWVRPATPGVEAGVVAAQPAPSRPARPRRPRPSPRTVLTWTGGVLLALAGIAFAVWAWTVFGPLGRFGILVAATVVAGVVGHLVRRRTPVTAESLDLVAVTLLLVDWVVGRAMVPAAVAAVGGDTAWALLGVAIVGVVSLLLALVDGSRVLPHLGVALASIGVVSLATERLSAVPTWSPWWLVAIAVIGWLPLVPLGVGRLAARRWPAVAWTATVVAALCWLVSLAWMLPLADAVGVGDVDGLAAGLAALGAVLVPVLAHRALPAAWHDHRATAAYGVAAVLGGLLACLPVVGGVWRLVDGWFEGVPSLLAVPVIAAAFSLAGVAACLALLRWARQAPIRTGAVTTLTVATVLVWAFGQVGLATVLDSDVTVAHLLWSAVVAALLALPAVAAAVAVPRLPWRSARRNALVAVLPYAASSACWYAALVVVGAATVAAPSALPVSLVCALSAVAVAAAAVAFARLTRTVALGAVPAVIVLLLCVAAMAFVPSTLSALQLAALLGCAAAVLLVWRVGAGTYLLARRPAFLPVAVATGLLLVAGGVLVEPTTGAALAALLIGLGGLAVWVVAARSPRLSTSGVIGGAATTAVVVTAGLRLCALPFLLPGLGLPLPAADLLVPLVVAWLVAALGATLLRVRWLPLPSGVTPAVSVAYGPLTVVSPIVAALLLAVALPVPAWVPATAFVAAAGAGWVLLAVPWRRMGYAATAMAFAALATLLAGGWVLPVLWGPTVLCVVVSATAVVAAVRTEVPWVEVVTSMAAAVFGAAVAPLAVVAAGVGTDGSAWPALATALGGALLLAGAPSLPARAVIRVTVGGVGMVVLVVAAGMSPGAQVLGTVLVLAAVSLLLASRWEPARSLRYAGLLVAVGSAWAYLAAASVSLVEAWTVPAAAALLVAGLLAAHDPHRPSLRHPSWLTVGPALTVLVVPSAVLLLAGDAPLWRVAGLGVLGAVALAWGLGRHEQAPAALGLVALAAVAVQVLTPVVTATPLWVVLAVLGVALTWTGFTWERRRAQARHAVEHWAHFV